MKKLDKLTDNPKQQYNVPLDNGGTFTIYLEYLVRPQIWKMNIRYMNFQASGMVLSLFPNCLRQFRNVLPFGLMVLSNDSLDPRYLDDFTTGRISLFVLNTEEVEKIEVDYIR